MKSNILDKELAIAGLLSGFERFYGDTESFLKEYRWFFDAYVDVDRLRDILILHSSETKPQQEILHQAREISLSESDTSHSNKEKDRHLVSVFARVKDTSAETSVPLKKVIYPFERLNVTAAFPREEQNGSSSLEDLKRKFRCEMQRLIHTEKRVQSFRHFFLGLENILKQYLWCISSSDYEGEDISLYHHAKMTSAIANCLDLSDNRKLPFVLLAGDFSGIQSYISAVSNLTENGVEKRLRARSFYVDIAVSIISTKILEHFNLVSAHSLLCTGGKFYLLLPNSEEITGELKRLEKEIQEELFSRFHGKIIINLAWIETGEAGLKDYSATVVELLKHLRDKKFNAMKCVLQNQDGWVEEKFVLYEDLKGKKMCPACRASLMDSRERICSACFEQTRIGVTLPKSRYIVISHKQERGFYEVMNGYYIGLLKNTRQLSELDASAIVEVQKVNQFGFREKEELGLPLSMRFMVNNIPGKQDNNIKSFTEIAEAADGIKRIAVLKADVDNLGFLFSEGLRTGERHFGTISRVNTLSGLLDLFFSGYVNKLIKDSYPNVYAVYSGGDDLFFIGPWNQMAELAWKLEEKFREFTGYNTAFTLSAAVSIFHPREWVAHMSEESEKNLKRVKNEGNPIVYREKKGRDAAAFMGEIYSWPHLKKQIENGNRLTEYMIRRKLNAGAMRRMVTYSTMYRSAIIEKNPEGFRYAPMLHYDFSRNYKMSQKDKKNLEWFWDEYVKDFELAAKEDAPLNDNLFFAESIVSYALYKSKLNRRG